VFETLIRECGTSERRVELIIAGTIVDVPIPQGAVHLGYLSRDVVWHELRERCVQFLVLLSRADTWGFVVAEAMASGIVPIVSPRVGSAVDLVAPVEPTLVTRSADEAAETIQRLDEDNDRFEEVADALRAVAATRTTEWAVDVFTDGIDATLGYGRLPRRVPSPSEDLRY